MKRTLAIDARWLVSGIGTYIFNLVSRIKAAESSLDLHLITASKHADRLRPFCDRITLVNAPLYSAREQLQVPWAARGCDLLHAPHYNAPLLHPGRMLVTIHDLTHLLDPGYGTGVRAYAAPMLRLAARRAGHIITVSEYSRRRIVERLGVRQEKVTVAPNGVSSVFRPMDTAQAREAVRRTFALDAPFILYVGNLKPHKNVPCLARAFALLRERGGRDHKLLIAGDDPRGHKELEKLAASVSIMSALVMGGSVSQEVLAAAYSAAEALVLPSFEEGFGLPVLEAMACGTPVLCSRSASLPEVAGDAAEFFDANSPEDLADRLESVLGSTDRRQELRSAGLARAAEFTWERSVETHCRIYRELLN